MDYLKNTEVWRGNKSYMHYEVDKWDIDENSDLYKPLNKKNEKDVKSTREYCDEHEFLYGNHTCEPTWKKNGDLDIYQITIHHNKKDKLAFVKNRNVKKKKKTKKKNS